MKNAVKNQIEVIRELDKQFNQCTDLEKSIEILKAKDEAYTLLRNLNKLWK